jgi:1-acyl-sn-glycerol-3-phosphate acyltransferase
VSDAPTSNLSAKPTRAQLAMYHAVRLAVTGFSKVFWRLEIIGRDNVPARGPFILAPVHRSNVDTPLVAAVTARRLRYMGKDAMWKYRWSAWFFTSMGGFPVHRGAPDREALRWCAEVLEGGEPLVMFPEGTRQEGPVVTEVLDGVAFVALRNGTPIVPVGIGGSAAAMPVHAKMIRPVKLTMVIGPAIEVERPEPGKRVPRRAVHELTEQLRVELQQLYDEAQARAGV